MNNQNSQSSGTDANANSSFYLTDPGKLADSCYEQNLRKSIISIHSDSSFTPAQKAKKIQVNFNF